MKNISGKIVLISLIFLCFNTALFSTESVSEEITEETTESKSAFELGMEIAELKYEIYKIDNKLEEYENMSDFDLSFEKAKKEHLLRKKNDDFTKAVDSDREIAEQILDKAAEDIISKAKELKDKGKDFLEYIRKYFEE